MLHLRAFTPEDGWAIVQEEETLQLIRPPYDTAKRSAITEGEAARMVVHELFTPVDEEFADWDVLISSLHARRLTAAGPDVDARIQEASKRILARRKDRNIKDADKKVEK